MVVAVNQLFDLAKAGMLSASGHYNIYGIHQPVDTYMARDVVPLPWKHSISNKSSLTDIYANIL